MKFCFLISFFFFNLSLYSQQPLYHITYKVGFAGLENTKIDDHENKMAVEMVKRTMQAEKNIELELYFNEYSSAFRLKDKLIPEGEEFIYRMASITAGALKGDVYYKNIKTKKKLKRSESTGEVFLIEYPFEQYKWEITNETKIIHGYKCYKATTHWEEFDYSRNILLKFDPVAWFTNEIPFPFGPKGLDGLPGLVLEASFGGRSFLYVTEIKSTEKVKEKVLAEPTKGRKITHEAYLKLLAELRPIRK